MSGITLSAQASMLDTCNTSLTTLGYGIFLKNITTTIPVTTTTESKPSPAEIWGIGLLFVTVISSGAAVGIALMPLLTPRLYFLVLTYFVGLGVGSLSGSAVFHLIPQAFELVTDDGDHGYLSKAWIVILGIYLFFFTDKLLQLLMRLRKKRKVPESARPLELVAGRIENTLSPADISINGGMSRTASNATYQTSSSSADLITGNGESEKNHGITINLNGPGAELGSDSEGMNAKAIEQQVHAMTCSHDHEVCFKEGDSVVGTVAWMIIFGDGLHNFIDGLSIGAAFSRSVLSGISVSVAVICEEFPHELGDVAILINAGMSLKQALMYNLLSAFTCYFGFILGVLLGELAEASIYIFALAGGMFLYISLASMIPEMNSTVEKQMEKSLSKGLLTLFLQAAGVLTGLVAMFLMSYYGAEISFE